MNSKFKRNLFLGYGLSLVLLIVSAGASYFSIRNLLTNSEMVRHTNEVISELNNILSILKDAETNQRGFLLSSDETFLEPFSGTTTRLATAITNAKNLTANNNKQLLDLQALESVAVKRIFKLQDLIAKKKAGQTISYDDLRIGKSYMDSARQLVKVMEAREQEILVAKTHTLNKFAAATPTLILVASFLSILVTIISFFRVNKDLEKRIKLQNELQQKDEDVSKRINIIQNIAEKIAGGDYRIRMNDDSKDVLGSLAVSLNKMAHSLQHNFKLLSQKEWLQEGVATLNEKLIGEKNMERLTYNAIEFITEYTKVGVGAFYLVENESLKMAASIALDKSKVVNAIPFGQGIAGQCALSKKTIIIDQVPENTIAVSFAGGSLRPTSILAIPVFYEDILKGVIELNAVNGIEEGVIEFLKTASYNIGMAIHSVRDHQRLQALLEETQAQSEELQTQHSELENINAELAAQSEKLQASEEELKVQQEELQQANAELEERSRLLEEKNEQIVERNLQIQAKSEALEVSTKYKSEFLANMSHELRTPLNSILLLSRLLSENHEKNLSGEQIEYAKVIQSSGNGLLTLIDEILDLSKIESGKMELEYSDVSIENLTNEIKALFLPVATEKKIDFKIKLGDDLPKIIETDKLRLEQILRNLLSNALKFTAAGSVLLHINKANGTLEFAVTDTGIGIPQDKQQSIFEAFQQADGSTRRKYGGTGLGLSISRELAKLLGGEILLKSEEGKGSTFTLSLPLEKGKKIENEKVVLPKNAVPEKETLPVQTGSKLFSKINATGQVPDDRDNITTGEKVILIIEDDTSFARSLLDFTRKKNYKGIVAVRGDEGIELARHFLPAGILLDIQLPVKNGWEVMDELKSNPSTRHIPVHMMSSNSERNKSLSKGAVDFIEKPVAFDKMADVFKQIEQGLTHHPKKVLIVEENAKHAKALTYFLESFNVVTQIETSVEAGIKTLSTEVDCVILDMGLPAEDALKKIEEVKKTPGLENLPVIIFTGKSLSYAEEMRIKQYADSIVIKTAHSYKRILDEVSLFLHLVEENNNIEKPSKYKKLGALAEVLKDKTVVIADDDVRNIFSLTKALENYEMKVLSAIDGKEAIRQLEKNGKVDIVLMDMMMPEMDGYESIKQIRSMPQFKRLPIIAVTAKAMKGDREKCINAGASDYITKPVDVDQLTSLLRVWLYQGA